MSENAAKTLYLCGGLQGCGSSLISWCFLQRHDMNGVFDTAHDMVPDIPETPDVPRRWCKITICCFRLTELIDYFKGSGWSVRPLMVVRDVREIWASLSGKQYGRNGTTAEDPPLRLRLQRFLSDWERAVADEWTIIRYESLIADPLPTLRAACQSLDIPWDQAMADWPKTVEEIADARYGNVNFLKSRSGGLLGTIQPGFVGRIKGRVAARDLDWLEERFAEFNRRYDYPGHRDVPPDSVDCGIPSFEVTRRFEWKQKDQTGQSLLNRFGFRR